MCVKPSLELKNSSGSVILAIDLGLGKARMGGSALSQVWKDISGQAPDLDQAEYLAHFYKLIQELIEHKKLLAYHDRGDGGLFVTLAEMCFAAHLGMDLDLAHLIEQTQQQNPHLDEQEVLMRTLFNEELGAVIQVASSADANVVIAAFDAAGLGKAIHRIGQPNHTEQLLIQNGTAPLFSEARLTLQQAWAETSYKMQRLRDNPVGADSEFALLSDDKRSTLFADLSFDINEDLAAPYINIGAKPKIAVLREQGVNGQVEMAAAFTRADFDAYDVHMSDLISGRVNLADFHMLTACGGFSYGDVLGAGEGWAKSILFNAKLRDQFSEFFVRSNTLTLGVCNGCQMMSNLSEIIPGASHWPKFKRNLSEQFEARLSMVNIPKSPSLILETMVGSSLPVVVSHGEGRADFALHNGQVPAELTVALHYVDGQNHIAQDYPLNPNGSTGGIAGVSSADGRVTIMMPHPERVYRTAQMSWHPAEWAELSAWYRLFSGARKVLN